MADMIDFNSDAAKALERVYLTPDVVGQRARVLTELALKRGEAVLDVGVGPGLLAYDMAYTVGDRGKVAGIDVADAMLAMSRERCKDLPHCDFRTGDATGARDLFTQAAAYGEQHTPDAEATASAYASLAWVTLSLEGPEAAIPISEKAIAGYAKIYDAVLAAAERLREDT